MKRMVLITGASRGIGKAVASLYAEKGYNILTPSHEELDLSSKESVERYIRENSHRCIEIIVNNAGVNYINVVENTIDFQLEEMINVNLMSPFYLVRGFVPIMKSSGFGRIVNIGSIWGVISKPGRVGYSITKHGIHGITKTLALELARDGILVNTVSPGQTMTELTVKNNSPQDIEKMKKDIPVGRLADPTEIAKVVYYLGSEENTYITGQNIFVSYIITNSCNM